MLSIIITKASQSPSGKRFRVKNHNPHKSSSYNEIHPQESKLYKSKNQFNKSKMEKNETIPALQEVGGSFCRSLSSFKILLDAIP